MNKRMMGAAVLMVTSAAIGGWPVAASAQPAETAAGRFVAQEAEVTDTLTGLVWRRCSEGQSWSGSTCAGSWATFTWQGALDRARSAAAGGVPWRLPNAKELSSLVDDSRYSPAIDTAAFPGTPVTYYWTSTHIGENAVGAWYVHFGYGGVNNTSFGKYYAVRLVRAGQ